MKAQILTKKLLASVVLANIASSAFAVPPSSPQPLQGATTVQQALTDHRNVSENGFDRTPLGERIAEDGFDRERIAEDGFDRTPLGERIAEDGFDRTPLGERIAEDGFDRTPLGERIAEGGFDRTPMGQLLAVIDSDHTEYR
ncbi:hypothetical protein ACPESN_16330 [Stutzerimonas marianensis]|uniref:hypothetical protein n=1 Tax=Stutzerimonas marianensis TaxID=2929513 RepID=UPI003C2BFA04